MKNQIYRLGIIGTGNIAHRFVPEARTVEGIEIVAVYNPRLSSAQSFAEKFEINFAIDDVEVFMQTVDAVYIASPHETHVGYGRQMLSAGKHVLCEKPLCFSRREAEELFALAEKNGCIFMEAVKTAYCPGFQELLNVVNSGKIGQVVDVEACFSRLTQSNARELWDENYGGSFTEFGPYTLLPIVKLLGVKTKTSRIWTLEAKNGADIYTKTSFDAGKATALAKTGLAVKSEGQLVIAGTKGYILAPSPWWLTRYFEVRYEDPNKIEKYYFTYEGQGLRYEIREFVNRMNGTEETGLTAEDSIWFAEQMEMYQNDKKQRIQKYAGEDINNRIEISNKSWDDKMLYANNRTNYIEKSIGIWAHRGCSLAYPENTLSAFQAAADLEGITGIELDVQLTSDGEIVVIHDETVDRVTNGSGKVCNFTLKEIKELKIIGCDSNEVEYTELITSKVAANKATENEFERIPTMREVFELLEPYCKEKGLLINIELKNSKIRYEGMEQQLLELVKEYELENYIVYSSFLPESMALLKQLDSTVKTGILGMNVEWCMQKAVEMNADAIHPWIGGLEVCEETTNFPVRVWNTEEPFFGQDRVLKEKNMTKYGKLGATDVITNVPDLYL